jgi:hypothetical protein
MEPGADTLPRASLMMQLSQQLLCYRRLMNRIMGDHYLIRFLSSKSCGAFAFGNDNHRSSESFLNVKHRIL